MSFAGMSYSYRLQNHNTLLGTLNDTTIWRQLPYNNTNDTLSLLRFENIAGEVVNVPDGVTVTENSPALGPIPAIQLGQQFLLEWAKSYNVRMGQDGVRIDNQRQQSVRASGNARVLRREPIPVAVPQQQQAEDLQEPVEEVAALQIQEGH